MKKTKLFLSMILFFCFSNKSYSQLDSIINLLSKKSLVLPIKSEKDYIIKTGYLELDSKLKDAYKTSAGYYYHLMDSLASDQQLIELTSHQSPIVQSYAAIALSFRDTLLLPMVLQKMLDDTSFAECSHVDVAFDEISAKQLYYGVLKKNRQTGFPSKVFIDKLDSIYLIHKNTPEIDISLKLFHLRSKSLNPVIEKLAFERKKFSAIQYFYNWYKAEYYSKLNKVCLELLDSNNESFYFPSTLNIIEMLIDLDDDETNETLGLWLKKNRNKWVGIKGIDEIIDKSNISKDIIGWGYDRYPINENDIQLLIGDWEIISGMDIIGLKFNDTIVLERIKSKKSKLQKIGFRLGISILYSYHYENTNDKKPKMVGTYIFDSVNCRINLSSLDWKWYKIIKDENRLIFVKE